GRVDDGGDLVARGGPPGAVPRAVRGAAGVLAGAAGGGREGEGERQGGQVGEAHGPRKSNRRAAPARASHPRGLAGLTCRQLRLPVGAGPPCPPPWSGLSLPPPLLGWAMGRHPMAAGAARSLAVALALAGACTGGASREPAAVPAAPPAAAAPHRPCVLPGGAGGGAASWEDEAGRAVVVPAGSPCARRFTLRTTAALRDGEPDNPRVVLERPGQPALRTGSDLFDALYALALAEVREASVASIRDDAFGGGQPLPCPPGGCFETGRLWTYVWTRDTAYAVDLALAAIDPLRARNSLELKLSERRGGGDVQVVQDTGSGGSYPISTDRVAWAYGAA